MFLIMISICVSVQLSILTIFLEPLYMGLPLLLLTTTTTLLLFLLFFLSQLFQPTGSALPLSTQSIQWKMAPSQLKRSNSAQMKKMRMIFFLKFPSKSAKCFKNTFFQKKKGQLQNSAPRQHSSMQANWSRQETTGPGKGRAANCKLQKYYKQGSHFREINIFLIMVLQYQITCRKTSFFI